MLKKSTLLAAIWVFSTFLLAQPSPQQQAAREAPDNTTCSFNYSSGAGSTHTSYCLSVNGNIVQLASPAGHELIDVGNIYEGYGVCDLSGGVSNYVAYYDYARNYSANWGATVVSAPNATTRKFVRSTEDGIWQLTQTIKQIKSNASSAGSVKITMALKNLSGVARPAWLLRMADVDAGNYLNNQFVSDHNSAWAAEPGGYGLLLITNTLSTINHSGFVQSVFTGPDPCSYGVNLSEDPFVGDGSILHFYYFPAVNAGATKTVTMTYKPI